MPERAARRSSVAEVVGQAGARLAGAGVGNARREAAWLWAAVAGEGVQPADVWLLRDRDAAPEPAGRFWEAVERRVSGVPLAYAIGRASFRTLELKVDRRTLIPRPETEGLVELVLGAMRETGQEQGETWGVAADLGTGCGCIALSLAVEGEFARVIAVERSAAAAAVARDNVALVGPRVPVAVRQGDFLAALGGERCRVIVSNPPYLSEQDYAALDPSVRRFEPREALVSGADGLAATRVLLAGARALLEPGGTLALEIDARRAEQVRALARGCGWSGVAVRADLFGRPRFLLAHA